MRNTVENVSCEGMPCLSFRKCLRNLSFARPKAAIRGYTESNPVEEQPLTWGVGLMSGWSIPPGPSCANGHLAILKIAGCLFVEERPCRHLPTMALARPRRPPRLGQVGTPHRSVSEGQSSMGILS